MLAKMGFLLKLAGLGIGFYVGNSIAGIVGGFVLGMLGLVAGFVADQLFNEPKRFQREVDKGKSTRAHHRELFRLARRREPKSDEELDEFVDDLEQPSSYDD